MNTTKQHKFNSSRKPTNAQRPRPISNGVKVLFIGSDRNIFTEGSAPQKRMIEYASLFEELHILVFAKNGTAPKPLNPARNLWVYSTESKSRWLYSWDAIKAFKRIGINVDVVSAQDPFESSLAGVFIKRLSGAKFHVQLHTDMFSPHFTGALNNVRKIISGFVFIKANAVRVVSAHLRKKLVAKYAIAEGKVNVLPIFTDISRFREEGLVSVNIRQKYPQFKFRILVMGRLEKEKNLFTMVDVIERVRQYLPEVGVILVGEGREKERLKIYITSKGLDGVFIFEGSQKEVVGYYKTADILLHTSYFEGYGRVFVEAAAAQLPMVTSRTGLIENLPDEVAHKFSCHPDDKDCYAEKVKESLAGANLSMEAEGLILKQQSADFGEYMKAFKEDLERTLNQNER